MMLSSKSFAKDSSKQHGRDPVKSKQIDGIWHTGLVVYGKEFYFGSAGIEYCPPCGTILGDPDAIKVLGSTEIQEDLFNNYLMELNQHQFRPEKYNLFDHNCNTFSNEASQFLTGRTIPKTIQDLPQEVLNTPFGAMLKPIIDSMSVRPHSANATSLTDVVTSQSNPDAIFEPRPSEANDASIIEGPKIKLKQSKDVPVIYDSYKISLLVSSLNTTIEKDQLKEQEILQVKEIEEILQSDGEDKVTENHLQLLESLLEKYESSNEDVILTNIIQTLGLLVLNNDIIVLVCKNPVSKPVFKLARDFSHFNSPDVQCAVVELFTNICSTDVGRDIFVADEEPEPQSRSRNVSLTDDEDLTVNEETKTGEAKTSEEETSERRTSDGETSEGGSSDHDDDVIIGRKSSLVDHQQAIVDHRDVIQVTVKAILSDHKNLCEKAAALVYNISMAKVSEESALECASALLECLRRSENNPDTVYHYLFALRNFMKISPEIVNLASVIGIELTKFIKLSNKIEDICNELQQYLVV